MTTVITPELTALDYRPEGCIYTSDRGEDRSIFGWILGLGRHHEFYYDYRHYDDDHHDSILKKSFGHGHGHHGHHKCTQ